MQLRNNPLLAIQVFAPSKQVTKPCRSCCLRLSLCSGILRSSINLRYFGNPYGAPRPTESQNPPATKKIPKNRKPRLSPKVNARSPKVNILSPKVNVKNLKEFLKNLKFLKFLVGGSRSQRFRKYLSSIPPTRVSSPPQAVLRSFKQPSLLEQVLCAPSGSLGCSGSPSQLPFWTNLSLLRAVLRPQNLYDQI